MKFLPLRPFLTALISLFFSFSFIFGALANNLNEFNRLSESEKETLVKQLVDYLNQNPGLMDNLMDTSIPRFIERQVEVQEENIKQQQEIIQDQAKLLLSSIKDNDHFFGAQDSPFLLIDYSDFQCPFCKRFHPTAQLFIEQNPDVALIYRHFPLPSHEPLASKQAVAAECMANIKSKEAFWLASDLIFEKNPNNDVEMIAIANQLGISSDDFMNCFTNIDELRKIGNKIDADLQEGQKVGVRGTPGVFLINRNSKQITMIPGAVDIDYLNRSLEEIR